MIPLAVSKPIDKGVTSKSSKSCTFESPSPVRMAACTAAPKSSAVKTATQEGPPSQAVQPSPSRRTRSDGSLQAHRRYCCCWCCCFSACSGKVEYDVQYVCVALSGLSLSLSSSPRLLLCLFGWAPGLFDPVVITSLFGCSSGCSPDSSTPSRRSHVRSPLSTRMHHAFFHQIMCPFDTSFSSCIEFASFFASTHFSCVAVSSSPSCPSWASTSLSSSRSS